MPPSFGEPLLLGLLALVPIIVFIYWVYGKRKKRSALKFSSLGIIKQAAGKKALIRTHLPFALMVLAAAFIIIGLADPIIPLQNEKQGVNVVLVIDGSGSMAANDYDPTRLDAAKTSAATLINSLQPKDNVGIVIFESGATTSAYLTPFKNRALDKLARIQQREGRTAIGDGLALAIDMATSIPNKRKVVILLSDGVNNAGVVSPDEAIEFAKANNIQVHTIGLGSEEPVVLGYDFMGNAQFAELDETTLKRIAGETSGNYYKSVNGNTLNEVYGKIGKNIEREWEDTSVKEWFFGGALFVLLVEIYLIYGKFRVVV